jgi:hypothetical protein
VHPPTANFFAMKFHNKAAGFRGPTQLPYDEATGFGVPTGAGWAAAVRSLPRGSPRAAGRKRSCTDLPDALPRPGD